MTTVPVLTTQRKLNLHFNEICHLTKTIFNDYCFLFFTTFIDKHKKYDKHIFINFTN